MVKIVILDDEKKVTTYLQNELLRYAEENDQCFDISVYHDAITFLEEYHFADIIFMDIEMPLMNGMTAAEQLRKIDGSVALIFVTNMSQYAIQGYTVNAIDYILKPISYKRLSSVMSKVLRMIGKSEGSIMIRVAYGFREVRFSDLMFVNIKSHFLLYYTKNDRIESWGSLSKVEAALPPEHFIRCSHDTIINMKYVTSINKNEITLGDGDYKVLISSSKKKEVTANLMKYKGLSWKGFL